MDGRGHLCLTRKVGQGIRIITGDGTEIRICLEAIKGRKSAKVSIDAPKSATIVRDEVEANLVGETGQHTDGTMGTDAHPVFDQTPMTDAEFDRALGAP